MSKKENVTIEKFTSANDMFEDARKKINIIQVIPNSLFEIAFVTPSTPPAARAYRYSLPPEHAFAPMEIAFKICVPLLMPPSQIISIFPPTLSTISSS